MFSSAWYKATKPENIISGFRKAGVCPFNSQAITVPDSVTVFECSGGDSSSGENDDSHGIHEEEMPLAESENLPGVTGS